MVIIVSDGVQVTDHSPLVLLQDSEHNEGDQGEFNIKQQTDTVVPLNAITATTKMITPDMLPLIDLTQDDINTIILQIDGGLANIQDIYSLSSVQDGILFHHIMATKGDPYLTLKCMIFDTREILDQYLDAYQKVIDRHDILRTAFLWQGLSRPAQVVLRRAKLCITEVALDLNDGPAQAQLLKLLDPREQRIDLTQAPSVRFTISQDVDGRWVAVQVMHHLIDDQYSLQQIQNEIQTLLNGEGDKLELPQPYRNLIAQIRSSATIEEHEAYFTQMLAKIDTPALPYGISDSQDGGIELTESHLVISHELVSRLRERGKGMGVSFARMCHLAWALVLAVTSGQSIVVFGTVVSGRRLSDSASRVLGPFINTLPFCIDMKDASLEDILLRVQSGLTELVKHQHASLTLAQQCSSVPTGTPLFSSILNYRRSNESTPSTSGILGMEVQQVQERTNYPFSMTIDDGAEVKLICQVASGVDSLHVCQYMEQALKSIANGLDSASGTLVLDLEILPLEERELLLQTWNDTNRSYPEQLCAHHLFEIQAKKTPEAIALEFGDSLLTYKELNDHANRFAARLLESSVKEGDFVATMLVRSFELVIAQIAILKVGAAYVPIDPKAPTDRQAFILQDCAAALLVIDDQSKVSFETQPPLLHIDLTDSNDLSATQVVSGNHSSLSTAYAMYTSGSTGVPKGVLVSHRGITRLAINNGYADIGPQDRVAFAANPAFDASTFEIWAPLLNGGRAVIIDSDTFTNSHLMGQALNRHQITTLFLTTVLFNQFVASIGQELAKLKYLLCGGELENVEAFSALMKLGGPENLLHVYGPTETTTFATSYRVTEIKDEQDRMPIGQPISNTTTYVLDSHKRPVPIGVEGELYIGGAGVANGYLNRPDLTAERFLPDPFSATAGARMYRTGDIVRYLPDGALVFVSRNDHQVKIRGFRIELAEIEARLLDHALVKETIVLALGVGGDKRLIAYVVADSIDNLAQQLRDHLVAVLPEYMVPAALVRMDLLPLTPNGKVDREALPEPNREDFAGEVYEAPKGQVEIKLAGIWAELLKIDQIGRHDNFFMLGGHSLLAVQMIERLRRVGLRLTIRALFNNPTLSALAQALLLTEDRVEDAAPSNLITTETTTITPDLLPLIDLTQQDIDTIVQKVDGGVANIQDIYALSPLQDGILFHHIIATKGDPYLLSVGFSFDTRGHLDRYLSAFQKVVDRQDILRTAIVWDGLSTPSQVVSRSATLLVTERVLNPADGPLWEQLLAIFDPREHRMDLEQAPLMRFMISPDVNGRWVAMQLWHHLIGDHTTLDEMNAEIQEILEGRGDALASPQPYRNLIAQARSVQSTGAYKDFFSDMLAEIDTPTLPFGVADVHNDGLAESHVMLPEELNTSLRRHAKSLGVSLASMCHLAWAQVLAATSGQNKVVFGTVLFGRMASGSGADKAMGLFINTIPIRIDVDRRTVLESLKQTHADLAVLMEHEHTSLALAQRCSSIPAGTPLFSAMLNYRHYGSPTDTGKRINGLEVLGIHQRTNYPFVMNIEDAGTAGLGLTAQIIQPFESSRMIGYMRQALQGLSDALEHKSEKLVQEIQVLPDDERELLVKTWNQNDGASFLLLDSLCTHQLFEAQVTRSPEAVAVVHSDQSLTYSQLNERANQLAHNLIGLGVKPDTLVALCVERSLATAISILAIHKAGGAYLPLDPVYASSRLLDIIADAGPSIIVADALGRQTLGDEGLSSLTVVDPNTNFETSAEDPLVADLTSNHLAYVIYTSGSTGRPKGVMVEHTQVVRLFGATAQWYHFNENDIWMLAHSFSFDVSVWELWGAFFHGGKLIIPSHSTIQSPEDMYKLICAQGVTILNLTPSAFRPLIRAHGESQLADKLRFIILAGEALEAASLQPWYAKRSEDSPKIVNMYGTTETTVHAAYRVMKEEDCNSSLSPIGSRIPDLTLYVLDSQGRPAPLGAIGELCIGGLGVTRGYLNRPEMNAERFPLDPFSKITGAKLYKTGDLGRFLPDGNLVFLGRNDHQVKIRGFRIELGEIEARLMDHELVRETLVLAVGSGSEKKLVAYIVADFVEGLVQQLRDHLVPLLPDYMVPAAFIRMDQFPLTPNGKLDRRALPEPERDAFANQGFEAPQGDVEVILAAIWADILKIDQIGRHDNFFMLGGHSLLAVQMMERLRRVDLELSIRSLFDNPTLSGLALSLVQNRSGTNQGAPANLITLETTVITPELLPLIDLSQDDIDAIVQHVDGGVANIQDIYALSPLQDGILFHHIMATNGDLYVSLQLLNVDTREIFDRYLSGFQFVVDRNDILRTAVLWEGLSTPAQVVLRHAAVTVIELKLDPADGPVGDQLLKYMDPKEYRIDLTKAPLIRFAIAQDIDGSWMVLRSMHHIIDDNQSLQRIQEEIQAFLDGSEKSLPRPQPFRNLIAQTRTGPRNEGHEAFFTNMLAEIDTPALPYGVSNVHGDGADVTESHLTLPKGLNDSLRRHAKRLGISVASVCHLAWAQVIAATSRQSKVVFGTVLFGRMQAGSGADQAMGVFINTLPIRIDIDGRSVLDSVMQTHVDLIALLEHEHASLATAQQCSSVAAGTPLFSAIMNYRHRGDEPTEEKGIQGVRSLAAIERTNYPFGMSIEDFGTSLGLTSQTVPNFDSGRLCAYMQQALQGLSDALDSTDGCPVGDIEILPFEERAFVLQTWNDNAMPFPDHLCVHQLIESQALKSPEAIAIVYERQSFTYKELNDRANKIAHHLIRLGVKPDSLVALCVDRSLAMIVSIVAIMKAGGAYVPLDPSYASDRLTNILSDAAPLMLVANKAGCEALGDDAVASLTVVDPNSNFDTPAEDPVVDALTTDHLAYVIYTSGSSGKPKGVMVEHRGLTSFVVSRSKLAGLDGSSRVTQFFSISFDPSVFEIFSTLCFGGSLHILSDQIRHDRNLLWKYFDEHSITHANMTPATLQDCKGLASLTTSLYLGLGGEALSPTLLRTLNVLIPNGSVVNDYGPTETTIIATTWNCPQDFEGEMAPIGKPILNKRAYILDERGSPVPLGVQGELYIGGEGVARGYLNRPDLTANSFLPDPFSGKEGARMYKTGDLVRYLPDGNIVFLGRNDHQIKIRGFRVELGEIESRLVEHALVRETVVLALGSGSDKRLVAYVVADFVNNLAQTLRDHLTSLLPDYMVPAAYVRLDAIPLTTNNKIDRRALPDPDRDAFTSRSFEEPQGRVEIALAEIWSDLLKVDRISRHDNFFMLGGHSLLAVQLMERLRRVDLQLSIRALFDTPTLSILAQSLLVNKTKVKRVAPANLITTDTEVITPDLLPLIDLTQEDIDAIVKKVDGGVASIQDIYPLSPLQDGILFHHLLAKMGDPYLLTGTMAFDSKDILDRYMSAYQKVVDRHDILRTGIVSDGLSSPAQVVYRKATLSVTEVKLDAANGPVTRQLMDMFDPREHRIDLAQAPLIRFAVAPDTNGQWIAIQLLHHLIGDHSTLEGIMHEIQVIFAGQEHTLAPPQPYRNMIDQAQLYLSGQTYKGFFSDMLAEVDTPALPYGVSDVHHDGVDISEFHLTFPESLNDSLRAHAKRLGVSLASLCHIAWAQVIAATSGQDKVVFGTVLFGRMQAGSGADKAMGLFINTLPVRIDVDDRGVLETVRQAQADLAALMEHEHTSLALAQRCSSIPAGTPLFSAMLNYRHNSADLAENGGLAGVQLLEFHERTNYPFVMAIEDGGDSLGVTGQVVAPYDSSRICAYMQKALQDISDALESNPGLPVRDIQVMPIQEQELLVKTWNHTEAASIDPRCIYQLFEAQVVQSPDAIAAVHKGQSLTYKQLNERANQVAHHLITLGVKPDTFVALCVERSLATVVGILAIHKAGGAYLPLDPVYASSRLLDIIADAGPSIMVADALGQKTLGGDALSSLTVVDPNAVFETSIENPLVADLTSNHLAYVIYTSGSTGTPKGVMVEHAQVTRLFESTNHWYKFDSSDTWIMAHSFSFDFSVWEMWGALRYGGKLVVPDLQSIQSSENLYKLVCSEGVSVLNLTPSAFRPLIKYHAEAQGGDRLRYVILGGEALEPSSLQPWFSISRTLPQIVNMYGITETTVHVSYRVMTVKDVALSVCPIGERIPDLTTYILDSRGRPVPLGAVGELCIGGSGVSRGYLNRPELNAEKFLLDPFSKVP
ncbi:hypothetical protein BGZ83_003999, partial [Gryganskiella cystojenkinii]